MYDVKILVNGKEIRLKEFPKRVAYNIVLGYVNSLNLNEPPQEINIHVKLQEDTAGTNLSSR